MTVGLGVLVAELAVVVGGLAYAAKGRDAVEVVGRNVRVIAVFCALIVGNVGILVVRALMR